MAEAVAVDPDTLSEHDRDHLREHLRALARDSYRRGLEWYWDAFDEDGDEDEDEPVGGGIEELVASMTAEEQHEQATRATMRRAFAFAAARGRLLGDPRQALQVTLANARHADPDGWPALQHRLVDLLIER
jgi:hypothetical protein